MKSFKSIIETISIRINYIRPVPSETRQKMFTESITRVTPPIIIPRIYLWKAITVNRYPGELTSKDKQAVHEKRPLYRETRRDALNRMAV